MFFIGGIQSKVRAVGVWERAACPVCGERGVLYVINKYMTPHVFFIPTFRFHNEYVATCGACASLFEVSDEKAAALRRGEDVACEPGDLQILQNNRRA